MVSVLCLRLSGEGTRRGRRGGTGVEEPPRDRRKYSISWVTPLFWGDYKGFNWRMKESKVVSDISGLGIWQSAAWNPAKSMWAGPENAKKAWGERV